MKRPTTVTIAGRTFPTVALICPPDDEDLPEVDRVLGGPTDWDAYIPAENGVLFAVQPDTSRIAPPGTLKLYLNTVACVRYDDFPNDDWCWLPASVALVGGTLVAVGPNEYTPHTSWNAAEPEWVVETIDRLSRKPFEIPDGPRVKMVPRDYFVDEEDVA